MIIISNLRKETKGPFVRIVCDIESDFSSVGELWFSVPQEYGDWMTDDVYDAFMLAMLYPAMLYNEPLEIKGCVTKRIYHNIVQYAQSILSQFDDKLNFVDVSVIGYKEAEQMADLHVGTGFSGGVDSFATVIDNFFSAKDNDYKLDTLFFFHMGQYGDVKKDDTWERALNRFSITRDFAGEVGMEAVMMNTNLFDFYKPSWEFSLGLICRIVGVLVFQRSLKLYFISSSNSYQEWALATNRFEELTDFADPYLMPLLSTGKLEIVFDGGQYKRTEKTAKLVDNPFAQRYLNVCVDKSKNHTSATNCSRCDKCLRTLMALESLGALDKFKMVFDLNEYSRQKFRFKCRTRLAYKKSQIARDNIDFARKHNKRVPTYLQAFLYVLKERIVHLDKRTIKRIITR